MRQHQGWRWGWGGPSSWDRHGCSEQKWSLWSPCNAWMPQVLGCVSTKGAGITPKSQSCMQKTCGAWLRPRSCWSHLELLLQAAGCGVRYQNPAPGILWQGCLHSAGSALGTAKPGLLLRTYIYPLCSTSGALCLLRSALPPPPPSSCQGAHPFCRAEGQPGSNFSQGGSLRRWWWWWWGYSTQCLPQVGHDWDCYSPFVYLMLG